jgi:hypothetical protein
MLSTIVRFKRSRVVNITATVGETARHHFGTGTFHLENIVFSLETQDLNVVDKASVLTSDKHTIGRNQIKTRLDGMVKYCGDLKRLPGGWYTWV